MTTSQQPKTSTPTPHRRQYHHMGDDLEGTRIPLPSPQPFQRSMSLRLRGSSSYHNDLSSSLSSAQSKGDNCSPTASRKTGILFSSLPHKKSTLSSSRSLQSFKTADSSAINGGSALGNGATCNEASHIKKRSPNSPSETKTSPSSKRDHGMILNLSSNTAATSSSKLSPNTPKTPSVAVPGGQQKHTPKTPPVTPDFSTNGYGVDDDDDLDSLHSFSSMASGRSVMSCDHPYVARNGTTFSGRKMKYVVHCSSYAGQTGECYLTPTQRAQRQIRRLKELLAQARTDLEQKDSEILKLTKEVVELRLFKASLSSPEDRSNSSDAVTVRENTLNDLQTSHDISPIVDMTDDGIKSSPRHQLHQHGIHQVQFMDKISCSEMQSSFADSGHFEDLTTSSVHSKDSFVQTQDSACGSDDYDRRELIEMYEKKIEELIQKNDSEKQDMKQSQNDRLEALLQRLAECNTRYADLVPDYEVAKERIRELERQLEALQRKLEEQEDKANKMYLHMYSKGQEAERIQHADRVLEFAHKAPNRVSVPELMEQLQVTQDELENIRDTSYRPQPGSSQVLLSAKEAISLWLLGARKLTEHEYCLSSREIFERQQTMYKSLVESQNKPTKVDPEITLQFLKSAIYYFLTDKENSQGHLNAIESILGFSDLEKYNINRARANK